MLTTFRISRISNLEQETTTIPVLVTTPPRLLGIRALQDVPHPGDWTEPWLSRPFSLDLLSAGLGQTLLEVDALGEDEILKSRSSNQHR
jgi:hypothetical protein